MGARITLGTEKVHPTICNVDLIGDSNIAAPGLSNFSTTGTDLELGSRVSRRFAAIHVMAWGLDHFRMTCFRILLY